MKKFNIRTWIAQRNVEFVKNNIDITKCTNQFQGGIEVIRKQEWKMNLASEFYNLYFHYGLPFLKEQISYYSGKQNIKDEILSIIDICNSFYEEDIAMYEKRYWDFIKDTHSRETIIACTPISQEIILDYIRGEKHTNIIEFINTLCAMICIYIIEKEPLLLLTRRNWLERVLFYILIHPNVSVRTTLPRIRTRLKYYIEKVNDSCTNYVLDGFDNAADAVYSKDFISWKQVIFMNGYLLIFHPEHPDGQGKYKPFRYPCMESVKAFNHVSEYIFRKLPPIRVKYRDDVIIRIQPESIPAIQEVIITLDSYSKTPSTKVIGLKQDKFHALKQDSYTNEQAKKALKALKSDYLDYLSDRQLNTEKLYYCLERRINANLISVDEDAFLFSLKQTPTFTLLAFENTLPSRATILFVCANEKINETINFIHEYFSSPKMNKRERLIFEKLDLSEYGIINYTRVMHDSYSQWVKAIMKATKEISC